MCSVVAGLTALGGIFSYQQQQAAADAQAEQMQAQAAADAEAMRAQAAVAEQNARIENKKQESIANAAAQEASKRKKAFFAAQGAHAAQAGASGIALTGSQLDINASGLDAYYQDQLNLLNSQRQNVDASRYAQANYETEATNKRMNADATIARADAAADNIRSNARMAGIGTLLGTAASIAGSFGGGGASFGSSGGSSGAGSYSMPNTNFYTGVNSIDWNPARYSIAAGYKKSGFGF